MAAVYKPITSYLFDIKVWRLKHVTGISIKLKMDKLGYS